MLFVAALAVVSATGVAAQASTVGGKDVMASKSLSDDDREFMIKAAGGGLFAIEASKMAAVKSQSAEVKRYAAMLVKDHAAASETLTTIAVAKPLRLPLDMPDGKKADLNMLSKSTPAEFDEKYIKIVGIDDHQADIKLFEAEVAKERSTGQGFRSQDLAQAPSASCGRAEADSRPKRFCRFQVVTDDPEPVRGFRRACRECC